MLERRSVHRHGGRRRDGNCHQLSAQGFNCVLTDAGLFTAMEALQVANYAVLDHCGTPVNLSVTKLSYLHIAVQPVFIIAFAPELVPRKARQKACKIVFGICGLSTVVMLLQVMPIAPLGHAYLAAHCVWIAGALFRAIGTLLGMIPTTDWLYLLNAP